MVKSPVKLLCLSNGHGEDAIALRIMRELRGYNPSPELMALPLVGEGYAYRNSDISIAGPVQRMPSGGFVYMDGRQLARDLRGGLLQLTLRQLGIVRRWAKQGGSILAVGDIVPLLFAWWSGAPYAFVGTAKSEYYLRDEAGPIPRRSPFEQLENWSGSVYLPWERWLMSRSRCRAVFPRDSLTTKTLQRWRIPAYDLGNPMMDDLEPSTEGLRELSSMAIADALTIALLPGSRPPEAYSNWRLMLQAVEALMQQFGDRPLLLLAAIAPSLEIAPLRDPLTSAGWQPQSTNLYQRQQATLLFTTAFNDCLHQADFAVAMAGTATEQFVGLGNPAIILPGEGPQFTPAFAEAQTRLLGCSVILVEQPQEVPGVVRSLLHDPDRLQLIAENGHRRMGKPGAAERIANCLMQRLI